MKIEDSKLTIEDVGKVIHAIAGAMNGDNSYRTVLKLTLEELGIEYDPRAYQECLPLLYINNNVGERYPHQEKIDRWSGKTPERCEDCGSPQGKDKYDCPDCSVVDENTGEF